MCLGNDMSVAIIIGVVVVIIIIVVVVVVVVVLRRRRARLSRLDSQLLFIVSTLIA